MICDGGTAPAGLALVRPSIGLSGVLSSLVGQRTQEIEIRMALGARSTDVLRMVLGKGFRMVLLGVVILVGTGVSLSQYLASLFFGVSPANPASCTHHDNHRAGRQSAPGLARGAREPDGGPAL